MNKLSTWMQGLQAFRAGKPVDANPYRALLKTDGSTPLKLQAQGWDNGWGYGLYVARRDFEAQLLGKQAVPEGFALVPVEPTDAMRIAGGIAHESSPAHDVIGPLVDAWAAMLAAAPQAAQPLAAYRGQPSAEWDGLPELPKPYQDAITATAKNTPAVRAGYEEAGYEKSPNLYTAEQMRSYARAAITSNVQPKGMPAGYKLLEDGKTMIPEGWTPLRLEWEPGYPEDVACGPARAMERLKKWLDAYFLLIQQRMTPAPAPAQGIDTTALRELADAALIAAMKDGRHPNAKNNEALGIARQDLFAAISRLGAPRAPAVMDGQWVPVSERLPERNVEVLVAFGGISIPATGQYTGSSKDRDPNGWCYPAENNGICDDGSDPVVTHWMPLPDPPKSDVPVQPMGGA